MHKHGKQDKAFCSDILRELVIVQDDIQYRFRDIGIDCSQMRREALDVICYHPCSAQSDTVVWRLNVGLLVRVLDAVVEICYIPM